MRDYVLCCRWSFCPGARTAAKRVLNNSSGYLTASPKLVVRDAVLHMTPLIMSKRLLESFVRNDNTKYTNQTMELFDLKSLSFIEIQVDIRV